MGNNASEALKLAIGLVITMIFIAIVVVAFSFGRSQANNAISDMSKDTQAMNDSRITQYDGVELTGSAVLDVISKFGTDNIPVYVDTAAAALSTMSSLTSASGTPYCCDATGNRKSKADQQTDLRNAKTPGSTTYINPSANFYGYVVYDTNGTITALCFKALT